MPTLAFTLLFLPTHDLRLALTVSVAITVSLLIVRLIQRSTVQFVLNALVGIGIAALFAIRAAGKEGATAEEIGRYLSLYANEDSRELPAEGLRALSMLLAERNGRAFEMETI